jgi:hypothetical protein
MGKKKTVRGYKGMYVDETGYYCNPNGKKMYYEEGKEYQLRGTPIVCEKGFHFCKTILEVCKYYPLLQWTAVAEIEAFGKIVFEGDKFVTNKIKIVKILPFNEITILLETVDQVPNSRDVDESYGVTNSRGIINSNAISTSIGINSSDGVNNTIVADESAGVSKSVGVSKSDGVSESHGLYEARGISKSHGIKKSEGVTRANGVNSSDGVNSSAGIYRSAGVNYSDGVNSSSGISGGHGISESHGIAGSIGVSGSAGVSNSYGIFDSNGISNNFFAAHLPKKYYLFQKEVSQSRYIEVRNEFALISNNFTPQYTNLQGLYKKFGERWKFVPIQATKELQKEEAWQDLPKQAIDYLVSLPEFDADIFYEVTGLRVKI